MSNTSYPASAVCYILDDIPRQGEFQGTGVIIGPHTILTAAHLLYDAATGASADAVSVYPGFTPGSTAYNPDGALGGKQTIHFIKVKDANEQLSASGTQGDFAIIDTSADLSRFGKFALDPGFKSGDAVVFGYPASNGGNLSGTGGVVSQDGTLSDIVTSGLPLSPGYSGAPLFHDIVRNGRTVKAVVGTVSTNDDATKLTKGKIKLLRRWIKSDASLYAGGQDVPRGLTPQIAGTATNAVDAAHVAAEPGTATLAASPTFAYADHADHHARPGHHHVARHRFADLVSALHGSSSPADANSFASAGAQAQTATLAAPVDPLHHGLTFTRSG